MILIVDDFEAVSQQLKEFVFRLLKELNQPTGENEIIVCKDVKSAILQIRDVEPQLRLVVLDMCFGTTVDEGLKLLDELKLAPGAPKIVARVVINTAYDFPEIRRRAERLGVSGKRFVMKAEPLDRLKEAIALALSGKDSV